MSFKVASFDTDKIVFVREGTALPAGMFIGIGSIFLVIGIGINIFMEGFEFPFILFKLLFPLFGLGAVVVGIQLPKMTKNTKPEVITFDHNKALVIVEMVRDGQQKGFIRYNEIEKFDIHIEKLESQGNSTTNRSRYWYHVLLRKKDGGEWFLTSYSTKDAADGFISRLQQAVPLTKTPAEVPVPPLTDKISKEDGIEKTTVSWRNKVTLAMPLFLLVFSIIFISILSTAFTSTFGGLGGFGFFVVGFIFLVFCLVMGVTIKRLVKDATTLYAVSVGSSNFIYAEISTSTGQVKNSRMIPLQEVYGIAYSYSAVRQYGYAGLTVFTEKEFQQSEHDKSHPIDALKNLFSKTPGMIKLSIAALNPVECLQLENWLQELIRKKGKAGVL